MRTATGVIVIAACAAATAAGAAGLSFSMDLLGGRSINAPASGSQAVTTTHHRPALDDRERILEHIHSIFRAYIAADRQTLRDTHTEDWRGFTAPADAMMRGIDEYMEYADGIFEHTTPLDYELLDVDVSVRGDIAIVYYLARYAYRTEVGARRDVRLRSVDIYERRGGRWIQSGSNICMAPADLLAGAAVPRRLSPEDRSALLEARERVWRAWFSNDELALRGALPDEVIAIDAGVEAWAGLSEVLDRSRRFAESGARLISLEFPETRIQAFGPVAILYTTYSWEVETADGVRNVSSGRGTEVFVKRDGQWVNPGWHLDTGS